jgi:hypothetical protein
MVKDDIQSVLWTIYERKGYDTLLKSSWELMSHCEKNAKDMMYRQMKGEIAEVVLDCGLRELQKELKPSIVLKGLCIPIRSTNSTTEMDVILVTKRKIFMFECKSYKNRPKVTGECCLGDNMDVAAQSKFHLKGLHEYIGRLCKTNATAPYKFVLFEMSMQGVEDLRTPENKHRIPICNPSNFISFIKDEYNKSSDDVWDIEEVIKVLKPLAENSDEVFKRHLNRMIHKGG